MKLYTTLLTLLLALLPPKGGDAFLYGTLICPVVKRVFGDFLGDNSACSCGGTFRLFHGFGMEAACSVDVGGFVTTADVDLERRGAETEICIEIDDDGLGDPTACLTVKYRRGFFNFLSWGALSCKIDVDGEECTSCDASGSLPLPDITFNCTNLLPDDFDGF
jgi:hypothetical protein